MKKHFYLARNFDVNKRQKDIDYLNDLLKEVGVSFGVSPTKNDMGLQLDVLIDETKLAEATNKPKLGRPVGYDFDIEKVKQLKANGKTNKEIYKELGMSKSLFYLRMKEFK